MAVNILVARSYMGHRKVDVHTSALVWCKLNAAFKRIRGLFA
ncbi:hypothetical protein GGD81_000127 [Rhodobium orientis]|nr:hypothetical protein [Rhodobium orientis]MBB4301112.1 hypothetical protein [Rhodobium orientis]